MKENVKEYLLNNLEELKELVNDINSYDGSFDNLEVYENDDEFFNTFYNNNPAEAVRACYFGTYNYSDDYVKINAYGNIDSCSEWEYEEELQANVDDVIDYLENSEEFQDTWKELLEKSEVME